MIPVLVYREQSVKCVTHCASLGGSLGATSMTSALTMLHLSTAQQEALLSTTDTDNLDYLLHGIMPDDCNARWDNINKVALVVVRDKICLFYTWLPCRCWMDIHISFLADLLHEVTCAPGKNVLHATHLAEACTPCFLFLPLSQTPCSKGLERIRAYRKLKQLVPLLLGLIVLNGLGQDVNGFCIADALETRLRNVLQPILDLRVRVAINLCCCKVVQVLPTPGSHDCMRKDASRHAYKPQKVVLPDASVGIENCQDMSKNMSKPACSTALPHDSEVIDIPL